MKFRYKVLLGCTILLSLPILLYRFGRLYLIAPLTNTVMLPGEQ